MQARSDACASKPAQKLLRHPDLGPKRDPGLPTGPEPAVVEVEYFERDALQPLDEPEEEYKVMTFARLPGGRSVKGSWGGGCPTQTTGQGGGSGDEGDEDSGS